MLLPRAPLCCSGLLSSTFLACGQLFQGIALRRDPLHLTARAKRANTEPYTAPAPLGGQLRKSATVLQRNPCAKSKSTPMRFNNSSALTASGLERIRRLCDAGALPILLIMASTILPVHRIGGDVADELDHQS